MIHRWTDPCGLHPEDGVVFALLFMHLATMLYKHWRLENSHYYQRIWWVRQQFFTSTGDKISQIQNFRSQLMILSAKIGFSGLAAGALAQIALQQEHWTAKLRPLCPCAFFIVAIIGYGYVGMTQMYVHFFTFSGQCVGTQDQTSFDPKEKTKWDAPLVNRVASLATDTAKAYSISWFALRIGMAFLLWPIEPIAVILFALGMVWLNHFSDLARWTVRLRFEDDVAPHYYRQLMRLEAREARARADPRSPVRSSHREE